MLANRVEQAGLVHDSLSHTLRWIATLGSGSERRLQRTRLLMHRGTSAGAASCIELAARSSQRPAFGERLHEVQLQRQQVGTDRHRARRLARPASTARWRPGWCPRYR